MHHYYVISKESFIVYGVRLDLYDYSSVCHSTYMIIKAMHNYIMISDIPIYQILISDFSYFFVCEYLSGVYADANS